MSIYSATTNLTSILKKYSSEERDKSKNAIINKVRFEIPKTIGISSIIEDVLKNGSYVQYNNFISYLKQEDSISDKELFRIISDARQSVHLLGSKFSDLIETLLSFDWIKRNDAIIQEYNDFYITLMIAHNYYVSFCISNLISYWIPDIKDAEHWLLKSTPDNVIQKRLEIIHKLLERILDVMPMSFDIILECIEKLFPYYKKPSFVIGGYIHNILWLFEYKPIFRELLFQLILKELIHLDVNAPRNEIEECEENDENNEEEDNLNGRVFEMDECNENENDKMSHNIAETLDICMEKLFDYLSKFDKSDTIEIARLFKILLNGFNNVILPSHNTHHAQFVMFYFCSFKSFLSVKFLNHLWTKTTNPNMSAPIRQASIGYLASFLARAKYVSIGIIKKYLSEMCNWAHQYIQGGDSVRSNYSLKANIVFYSICQSIFYIIAFRSRDLTSSKENLLFLQSLQLSALVTCNLNPLKYCIQSIATIFAGVTRTYQLAYCHTILERNARRKLATVYANDIQTPEECLDTFFPFDPYLLKKSGKSITPIYLKYQASEADEDDDETTIESSQQMRRKRGDSELNGADDDVDDFIIDKRQRLQSESSINNDKELQFTYGSSPGFHNV